RRPGRRLTGPLRRGRVRPPGRRRRLAGPAVPPLAELGAPAVGAERDEEDALVILDRVRDGILGRDPPAGEPPSVRRDRERLVAEADVHLGSDRLLRARTDLAVSAERLVPRPPGVGRVLGEAGDEAVDVLALPRASVRVQPPVELV